MHHKHPLISHLELPLQALPINELWLRPSPPPPPSHRCTTPPFHLPETSLIPRLTTASLKPCTCQAPHTYFVHRPTPLLTKTSPGPHRPDFNTISIRLRALAHWQTCMAKVRLHVKATAAVWSLSNWVRQRAAGATASQPPAPLTPDDDAAGRLNVSTISCTAAEAAVAHTDRLLRPSQAGRLSHPDPAPGYPTTGSGSGTTAEPRGRTSLRAGPSFRGAPYSQQHTKQPRPPPSSTPTFGRMNSLPSFPHLGFQAGGSRLQPQRSERVRHPLVPSGSPPLQHSSHSGLSPQPAHTLGTRAPAGCFGAQGGAQQQQQQREHQPTYGNGPTALQAAQARHAHETSSPLARLRSSQNPQLYGSTMTLSVEESCIPESPMDSATPTDSGTLSTRSSTRALNTRRSWTAVPSSSISALATHAPLQQQPHQPTKYPYAPSSTPQQPQAGPVPATATHAVTEAWLATPPTVTALRLSPSYLRSTSSPIRVAPPIVTLEPTHPRVTAASTTPAPASTILLQSYRSPPLTSAVLQEAANIHAQNTLRAGSNSIAPPTLLRSSTTAIPRHVALQRQASTAGPRASLTPPPSNSEACGSMNLQPHHSSSLGPSDSGALTDGTNGDNTSTSSLMRARSGNHGSVLQMRHSSTGDELNSRGQSIIGSSNGMWSPVSGASSSKRLAVVRGTRMMGGPEEEQVGLTRAGSQDASGPAAWMEATTPESSSGGSGVPG